jgi:hypothetical protein
MWHKIISTYDRVFQFMWNFLQGVDEPQVGSYNVRTTFENCNQLCCLFIFHLTLAACDSA